MNSVSATDNGLVGIFGIGYQLSFDRGASFTHGTLGDLQTLNSSAGNTSSLFAVGNRMQWVQCSAQGQTPGTFHMHEARLDLRMTAVAAGDNDTWVAMGVGLTQDDTNVKYVAAWTGDQPPAGDVAHTRFFVPSGPSSRFPDGLVQGGEPGNRLWVACFGDGSIWTSPSSNGLSQWSSARAGSGPSDEVSSVAYGNGKYVAVMAGGFVIQSLDGLTWTSKSLLDPFNSETFEGVAFGGGMFVAVGPTGRAYYSFDGNNWTMTLLPTSDRFNSVAYIAPEPVPPYSSKPTVKGKFIAIRTGGIAEAMVYVVGP